MPTSGTHDWQRYSVSAISGGPERFYNMYCNASLTPYRLLLRKRFILSPTRLDLGLHPEYSVMYNEGDYSFLWLYYSELDNNGGTSPTYARAFWVAAPGRKRVSLNYFAGHSSPMWNPWFVTTGLNVSNGGTAITSVWRWLVDPYDGITKRTYSMDSNFV